MILEVGDKIPNKTIREQTGEEDIENIYISAEREDFKWMRHEVLGNVVGRG